MAAVNPGVLDIIDDDEVIREYGDQLGVTQRIFRAPEQLAALRDQRAKQQQAAQQDAKMQQLATQTGPALASSANVLANTPMGGGTSALQAIMGGGGGAAPQGRAA